MRKTKFTYKGNLIQPIKLATGHYSVLINGHAPMTSSGERTFKTLEELKKELTEEIDIEEAINLTHEKQRSDKDRNNLPGERLAPF
jgi:hypothetical protein